MRIALITFYDGAGSGIRSLASLALQGGHDVRLLVMHQFRIITHDTFLAHSNAMQSICNGQFRVKKSDLHPISANEIELCLNEIKKGNYDLIGVSSRSIDQDEATELISKLRQRMPETPLIAGGHGPTYDLQAYLGAGCDYIIRGEGEGAFMDLIKAIETGESPAKIDNLAWLDRDKLISNSLRPFIHDLDAVPLPLADNDRVCFIEDDKLSYRDPFFAAQRYGTALGRGCISKCTYCGSESWNRLVTDKCSRSLYRHKSIEKFLDELVAAREKGANYIVFNDEYLVFPAATLIRLFFDYKKLVNLPFSVNLHPEQLLNNEELLEAVLSAGLDVFTIGFQSGSEEFSRKVFHRTLNFDKLLKLAHILYDRNVAIASHFISGATFNTEAEYQSKLSLLGQLPYDPMSWRHSLIMDFQYMPTPGTRLMEPPAHGRIASEQWAKLALLAQIRHIGTENDFNALYAEREGLTPHDLACEYEKIRQSRLERTRQQITRQAKDGNACMVYDHTAPAAYLDQMGENFGNCRLMPLAQYNGLPAAEKAQCSPLIYMSRNTLKLARSLKAGAGSHAWLIQ